MSHEILDRDKVVLHKKQAWHNLGIVVDDAPTPREALKIIGADDDIVRRECFTKDRDGNDVKVPNCVANYRLGVNGSPDIFFGTVSENYKIIQNGEVADFCMALLDEGKGTVKCESVGTIQNGAKIWFLLKGEEFDIRNNDFVYPYVMVSNGHDGGTTFRVTPTSVRVVCSNTMHMVIPRLDIGELGESAISIRHTCNLMERVEEAKRALKHYEEVKKRHFEAMQELAKKDVDSKKLVEFFVQCYTETIGEVPDNPTTKVEVNRKNRATSALGSFMKRFDDERVMAGASWWNAVNAFSGLVQHDMKARGVDDKARIENRVESNVFGLNAWRTKVALQHAFKYSAV